MNTRHKHKHVAHDAQSRIIHHNRTFCRGRAKNQDVDMAIDEYSFAQDTKRYGDCTVVVVSTVHRYRPLNVSVLEYQLIQQEERFNN